MAVWRGLLNAFLADLPLNAVAGIDASGFERVHASAHHTKRTNLTIQQLKMTRNAESILVLTELVIKCIVHNLERSLAISHEKGNCPQF